MQVESKGQPTFVTRMFHNKVEAYGRDILERYFSHFDPSFLFFSGDHRMRYKIPEMGLLLLITMPFFFTGLYALLKRKMWPALLFLFLSPLPASMSFETPSSVRAIFMVVPLAVAMGTGTLFLWLKIRQYPNLKKIAAGIIILAFVYNFASYLNSYRLNAFIRYSEEWQYGYKPLAEKVTKISSSYKKVKMTISRGTPYIFFLFYNRYDPAKWHPQSKTHIEPDKNFHFINIMKMDTMEFYDEGCPIGENFEKDVLYVCDHTPSLADMEVIDTILLPNKEEYFVLLHKK